jgi:methyl-accepting chemotaxis protein
MNLNIAKKLVAAFAVLAAINVSLAVFAVNRLAAVESTAADLGHNWLPATRMLGDINTALADYRRLVVGHILSSDETEKQKYEVLMVKSRGIITDNLKS